MPGYNIGYISCIYTTVIDGIPGPDGLGKYKIIGKD